MLKTIMGRTSEKSHVMHGMSWSTTMVSCMMTSWVFLHLQLLLIFLAHSVFCGSIVNYLLGFDGELPFHLETGYVTVNESELFYYFIESETNPKEDPLMLWYSGGPGCSAFNGLIYEIGPLAFNISDYQGGLPSLNYEPHSWTKPVLFVDAPVGTGFSYATSTEGYHSSDSKSALQTYEFLQKWLIDHPNFLKVQLFVGADSYSGISAPIAVQNILNGNKAGLQPYMNLKGYIIGCPRTDVAINENSKIQYSHRMGLVSDELYESAKTSCNSSYEGTLDSNPQCYEDLQLIGKMIKDINKFHILEPKCTWASPEQKNEESDRRTLEEKYEHFVLSPPKIPEFWCRYFNYALSYDWANNESVQNALHIRKGTVQYWKRCTTLTYKADWPSVLAVHWNLSSSGLQVLVYNGDHDLVIPNMGTEYWIKELNLSIVNNWRPWFVDGQVAGYTIKYSSHGYRLTYATLKGAGHPPQEYKRRECYDMFQRWIHYYPL